MDDVRKALYGEKPLRTFRHNKSKYLLKKTRKRIQSKIPFAPKKDNAVVSFQNTVSFKESSQDACVNQRKNQFLNVYKHGRVSLDGKIASEHLNIKLTSSAKNESYQSRCRKLSKMNENAKSQVLIRVKSLKVSPSKTYLQP